MKIPFPTSVPAVTDKEILMRNIEAIEGFLCEKEPRVGDALHVIECIKLNMVQVEALARGN